MAAVFYPNGGNNILQQNPKITKIEADIAKNSKAIAYHQDKIGILEKANEGLKNELQQLKNNDIVMLVAMANLNFESLAKKLGLVDETQKDKKTEGE